MKRRAYPYYSDFLKQMQEIQKFFDVSYFPIKGERFSLLKFEFLKYKNRPLLVLMAGCHGEEPASVIALFQNYKIFKKRADALKINLIIYPLTNPWGFDRNKRFNRAGINCNTTCIHKRESVAIETKMLSKDLKKLKPEIFASLHEDDETKNEFYLFSFGQRKYEKPLLKVGAKYFPIHADSYIGEDSRIIKNSGVAKTVLKNGVIYDKHDGSVEDFMFHRGIKFSCCTETPSHQPLGRRIKCNVGLVLKLIELTAS